MGEWGGGAWLRSVGQGGQDQALVFLQPAPEPLGHPSGAGVGVNLDDEHLSSGLDVALEEVAPLVCVLVS